METIRSLFDGAHNLIPFLATTGAAEMHLSRARIIEALIIAVVTGGVTVYATTQVLEVKIDSLEKAMDKQEDRLKDYIDLKSELINKTYKDVPTYRGQ